MDLNKLFPIIGQLNLIPGVEGTLISGKFKKHIAGIVAVTGLLIQVLTDLFSREDYLTKLPYYFITFFEFIKHVFKGEWELVKDYDIVIGLTGFILLIIALIFYLFFLVKTFLIKYSEEPFQYTFWVNRFIKVDGESKENNNDHKKDPINDLLHHDIMERLSERIGRLSLLDETPLEDTVKKKLSSHIYIDGHYGFWHDRHGNKTVHIMPRIRIGSPNNPKSLTYPIKFSLDKKSSENVYMQYEDIMERVYSIIATDIYKQIKVDLKKKIKLFPTKYLRAVALFYEAEDFARSNTIDAYDHAITLYKESLRYFNVSYKNLIYKFLVNVPVLRLGINFMYIWSRTQIGYSKCLLYRREISAHTGRHSNPIFEIPGELNKVTQILIKFHNKINRRKWRMSNVGDNKKSKDIETKKIKNRYYATMAYLTFNKDSLWTRINIFKPKLSLFKKQIRILFDAYVVNAFAHYNLGAIGKAKEYLDDAKAIAPDFSENNALFLMVSGTVEPVIENKISLLIQATEIAPNFEIAQYLLAHNLDIQFREQDELIKDGAKYVIAEYEAALKISPGNIAALASQGYLYWLTNNLKDAKNKFKQGSEVKAIIKQTFIGELNYGLARIAAEEGRVNDSYYHYNQAIAADPGIGVYMITTTSKAQKASFYKHIDLSILKRYENFHLNFEKRIFRLNVRGIKDWNGLILKIKDRRNRTSKYLQNQLSVSTLKRLKAYKDSINLTEEFKASFIDELNILILDENFYHGQKSIKIKESYLAEIKYLNKNMKISVINKAFLQKAYPDTFEENFDASGRLNKNREIYDIDSKKVSLQILNRVHSFVLNDLGNALLNFFLRYGDFEILLRAKNIYKKSTELDAKNKVIFYNLARAYEFLGEKANTIENFEKAMKLDPSWHVCTTAYIQFQIRINNENVKIDVAQIEKKEQIRKVSEKSLNLIIERTKLSHIYKSLHHLRNKESKQFRTNRYRLKNIFKEIKNTRLDDNDVEALKLWNEILSYSFEEESNFKETEELSGLILEEYYPDNFDINTVLHSMYNRRIRQLKSNDSSLKNKKEACEAKIRDSLNDYLEQDPINYSVLTWIKDFFSSEYYKNKLDIAIKKVNNLKNSAGYYELLGYAYQEESLWNKAEEAYKKALESNPKSAKYVNNLGIVCYRKSEYKESLKYFREASNIDPRNDIYIANIGDALRLSKKWSKAEIAYKKALKINPDNANYENNLGLVFYGKEEFGEAIEYFEKASIIDPNNATYVGNIADAYRELKEWNKAENTYKKAIDLHPENARYNNELGLVYYSNKKYLKAIEYFEKGSILDPDNAIYIGNIADAYRELKEWAKAEITYKKAIDLNPENTRYNNELGLVYYSNKKYLKSIEYFEKASILDPDNATYIGNIADAYRELKQWDNAEDTYIKAIELNPESTRYNNRLGLVFYGKKEYTKAIKHYEKASILDPNNATYIGNIADAYRELKDWPNAESAYKKAIALNPENARNNNDLGIIYFNDIEYSKAIEYFNKASIIDPANATYIGNIADAYRLLESWAESEEFYKKAIELNPKSAIYYNNLGLVYLNKKDYNKAINHFEYALKLDPHNNIYLQNIEFTKNKQKIT